MIESLLIVEPSAPLRKKLVSGVHQVADLPTKKLLIYSAQSLKLAQDILGFGRVSLLMTNANLGEDGGEGLILINHAIPPGPMAPREKVCIYSDTVPLEDVPPGVIQISIKNISLSFLRGFIRGFTTNPN